MTVASSMTRWVTQVLGQLGLPGGTVTELPDVGSVNFAFAVGAEPERWVIRTPKDLRATAVFEAEQWCASRAGSVGVPTPPIPYVGSSQGRPYNVQRFVGGRCGDLSVHHDLWTVLGRYCARINEIGQATDAPTTLFTRFGCDLPTAWAAHLDYNLAQLDAQDELLRRGILTRGEQLSVRDSVRRLQDVPQRFGLSHGDPAPRNLIVPPGAQPVLIDWGSASFGPIPWADLLIVDRDRRKDNSPSMQGMVQFARAAGVDLVADWDVFTAYRLLHHVDLVRWAIDRRPDRTTDTSVALRAVLSQAVGVQHGP